MLYDLRKYSFALLIIILLITGYSKLLYFYGPILTLFVINTILFTLTALKIAAIKKETSMVLQSEQSKIHDKNETQR